MSHCRTLLARVYCWRAYVLSRTIQWADVAQACALTLGIAISDAVGDRITAGQSGEAERHRHKRRAKHHGGGRDNDRDDACPSEDFGLL